MKGFRLSIKARISLLALAGVLFVGVVGAIGYQTTSSLSEKATASLARDIALIQMQDALRRVHTNFQREVQEWKDTLLRGHDAALFAKHHDAFLQRSADVVKGLGELRASGAKVGFVSGDIDALIAAHADLNQKYLVALKSFNPGHPTAGQEVDRMVRGIDRSTSAALDKVGLEVITYISAQTQQQKQEMLDITDWSTLKILLSFVFALALLGALSFFVIRAIIGKLLVLSSTIAHIHEGDFDARATIDAGDELGDLAYAFNNLLDSRVATLAQIQKENDRLNESVLTLLRAVAQLAQKDMTVKIPVAEDVTGAVSDALNLLATETAKVLQEVSNISADVTSASLIVQQHVDSLLLAAADERADVEHTVESLGSAAGALNQIVELARLCNTEADNAIRSTDLALASVDNTVSGINSTRDVIRETEKRIKRLGERSQEISGVVSLINVIAERTHILALNAAMHAASAGEAGRGFAVVADEVQRLAENARQATQQIATLVNNIQIETADTVNTMNQAIAQIVEGSRLAEQAGQQMQATQQTTAELVASVKQIAASSEVQARTGQELLELASVIKGNNEKTSERLHEQSSYTNHLVEYAKQLLGAVRVFKLPG